MINNEFDDLDNDDEESLEVPALDLKVIKDNLTKYSSQKLCEIVVCTRYFSMDKQLAVICMEELANRRMAGDNFNFEDFIDDAQKELPPLDFSVPDLRTVLNQAIGRKLNFK